MRVVIFFDDLKNHVISKRDLAEKSLFQKFFDKVLSSTSDIGISRLDLMIKFKFSEKDIRYIEILLIFFCVYIGQFLL